MKKTLLLFMIGLAALSYSYATTPLSCNDIAGEWKGAFSPYYSIDLELDNISPTNIMGSIQFTDKGGEDGSPLENGVCTVNKNGNVAVVFKKGGDLPINLTITLKAPAPNQVTLFGNLAFYKFNGTLKKSSS